ncbi:MAG: TRAP transporter small permease [Christensenellales bacterium]|jgi:TRAP-type C4-dicarboxylate transport system permease small subunit
MEKKKDLGYYVDKVFWYIAALAIVCMAVGSSIDIIRRWIVGMSFPWMPSFCETCMAVMVWACIMPTQRLKGHVNVTILTSKLSPKAQKVLNVLAAFIGMAFFVIVFIQAGKQGLWAYSRKMYRAGDYTRFPIWWAYMFVPIGALAMFFQLLIEAIQGIIYIVKGEDKQALQKSGNISDNLPIDETSERGKDK